MIDLNAGYGTEGAILLLLPFSLSPHHLLPHSPHFLVLLFFFPPPYPPLFLFSVSHAPTLLHVHTYFVFLFLILSLSC